MTSADAGARPIRLTVAVPDAGTAERLVAEAWSAGAGGVEEREGDRGVVLIIYATRDGEAAQRRAIETLIGEGVRLEGVEPVAVTDWSEAWKRGLDAIVISDRLVVRPSFVRFDPLIGQHELIVDPGQAFGTGGHASTRLVLEWIDALAAADPDGLSGAHLLDVGTGSGVLALAALALGAERAFGFDLDGVAVREAAGLASGNRLRDRFELFAGGIEALGEVSFDLVVANLLRTELLPIADRIAAKVAPGGALVVSGLLAQDGPAVAEALARCGLEPAGERSSEDLSGDRWIAPLLRRAR